MDIEFHYYATAFIANKAGFTEQDSQTIAYASQYVDDNNVSVVIKDKSDENYSNFISQTMNILKSADKLRRVYPIFHFVPGETIANRCDGKMHLLNTTPNNKNVNKMLDDAFKVTANTRLYRIGIASHSFVDSWAHQNFVGCFDDFNGIGINPNPNIGHADAEHHPDWINHIWTDNRLVDSEINNQLRFLSAAFMLYEKYCHYNGKTSEWDKVQAGLLKLWGEKTYTGAFLQSKNERYGRYRQELSWLAEYNKFDWFDYAIEKKVRFLKDFIDLPFFKDEHHWRNPAKKEETDWYKFQEAIKEHERACIKLLSPIFEKMGQKLAVL